MHLGGLSSFQPIGATKMMIQPITHYDRRGKDALGNVVDREANGKRQRRRSVDVAQMVYFVRIEGSTLLKVGRTGNIGGRIASYEGASGSIAHCVAQLMVSTVADAVRLEAHAVSVLAALYSQRRREWFEVPAKSEFEAIHAVIAGAPVPIVSRNGDPSDKRSIQVDIGKVHADEARRNNRHPRRRG